MDGNQNSIVLLAAATAPSAALELDLEGRTCHFFPGFFLGRGEDVGNLFHGRLAHGGHLFLGFLEITTTPTRSLEQLTSFRSIIGGNRLDFALLVTGQV